MKKLKKLFLPVLIIVLSFSVFACGTNQTAATAASGNAKVNYPTKEVKVIVPSDAGSVPDLAIRALAEGFKQETGQALVVEDVPGGAQVPGTVKMAKSASDGYTLGILPSGVLNLRPLLQQVEFKFPEDFTPIVGVGDYQINFAARKDAPYNTVAEMVKYYKDKNQAVTVATSGVNTASHLVMEMLVKQTGLQYRHLPNDSGSKVLTALLGGHADIAIANLADVYAQVKKGDVKILGVPAESRYENLKDVPTLKEQGIDVVGSPTFDIYAPKNLPKDIADKLTNVFLKSMDSDQFKQFVTNTNMTITKTAPDKLIPQLQQGQKDYQKVLQK